MAMRASPDSISPKKALSRLRKSCSLPSCPQQPGLCMHCTCDGRCGQHLPGQCGVLREGNGKNCKRPSCPRDESCLHSTRATCCHCRNLLSSRSKRVREPKPLSRRIVQLHMVHPSCPESGYAASFKALCEYPEWFERRHCANLLVLVQRRYFWLHRFPIMLQCPRLKLWEEDGFVRLDNFEAGWVGFELACIYAGGDVSSECQYSRTALCVFEHILQQ